MYDKVVKETYESLFFNNYENSKSDEKEIESCENKNIEQNDIISRNNNVFSLEDDDVGDFESSANESSGGSDEFGGADDGSSDSSDDMSFDDSGDSDNSDMSFDESGDDSESNDSTSDSGDKGGLNSLDNNKGSSLNPFTQINQKTYHIDRLNELLNSIRHSIDLYNVNYADWSEVNQLKELCSIVADEQKSFVMQQNPENLIKLGLYYEQYDTIVQNISLKISKLNSNNKK